MKISRNIKAMITAGVLLQRMLPFTKCDTVSAQRKRQRKQSQENSIAIDLDDHMMSNIFTVESFRKRAGKPKPHWSYLSQISKRHLASHHCNTLNSSKMPKEKLTLKSDFHKYSQYGHAAVD